MFDKAVVVTKISVIKGGAVVWTRMQKLSIVWKDSKYLCIVIT